MGFALFLLALLFIPPVAIGFIAWVQMKRWIWWFFVGSLSPPIWALIVFASLFSENGDDPSTLAIVAPFILSGIEVIVLWVIWHDHDPRSAGMALAAVEGVVAIDHARNKRPIWAAVTGAGAVSQWVSSSRIEPTRPGSPRCACGHQVPTGQEFCGQCGRAVSAPPDLASIQPLPPIEADVPDPGSPESLRPLADTAPRTAQPPAQSPNSPTPPLPPGNPPTKVAKPRALPPPPHRDSDKRTRAGRRGRSWRAWAGVAAVLVLGAGIGSLGLLAIQTWNTDSRSETGTADLPRSYDDLEALRADALAAGMECQQWTPRLSPDERRAVGPGARGGICTRSDGYVSAILLFPNHATAQQFTEDYPGRDTRILLGSNWVIYAADAGALEAELGGTVIHAPDSSPAPPSTSSPASPAPSSTASDPAIATCATSPTCHSPRALSHVLRLRLSWQGAVLQQVRWWSYSTAPQAWLSGPSRLLAELETRTRSPRSIPI